MRTSIVVFTLAVLVALAVVGCPRPQQERFTSADVRGVNRGAGLGGLDGLPGSIGLDELVDGAGGAEAVAREVVEPDVVRRDGNLLYVLNQFRGLTIVDLGAREILARVPTYGYPRDLYLAGPRAYVLVGQPGTYRILEGTASFDVNSRLYVVDVSTPEQAHVMSKFDMEGDLVDSRLVGNVLYAVGADVEWGWDVVPGTGGADGGVVAVDEPAVPAVRKAATGLSWVTSINVADPDNIHEADRLSFDGQGTVIQATSSAIFVAAPDWSSDATTITYIDIDDAAGQLEVRGSVQVQGQVADRFKMDAYEGVLRVVSSVWATERRVNLTTVRLTDPDNLQVLAEHDFETAHGDSLFATRFDGPRGYVVTYFQVDPLYVLDLSDPANPRVAGELEVPGWSTHIEPMGDRLLALGVDDTNGRRVSVSLFNVTDPEAPALVERVSFGDDWSWSSAHSDVKAFAVFDGLAVVPFSGWNYGSNGYDRLQFIGFTRDDLTLHGYVDLNGAVLRTLDYNSLYYGLTQEELATIDASDLDNPEVIHRLPLAENVVDFAELSPGVGAEVVAMRDGKTVVHTVDTAGKVIGSVETAVGDVVEALPYESSVVLVGSRWESSVSNYVVAVVDCSDPAQPEVDANFKLEFSPFYYWDYPILFAGTSFFGGVGSMMVDMPAYWWWWGIPGLAQDTVFRMGDTLVIRGRASSYDATVGDVAAQQGVALVDLTDPAPGRTVGLGFADVVSVDPAGLKLVVGTRVAGQTEPLRPVCSYYVTEVDVLADVPVAGPTANVPGTFVQYDPDEDILTLLDDQWSAVLALTRTLRTVRWDGSAAVTSVDSVQLPGVSMTVLGRGDRVYFDAYDDRDYGLYAATVSASGALDVGERVTVADDWAGLVDAKGDSAFVQIAGQSVARYLFDGNEGELAEELDVMATPTRIRFGETQAYLVLGNAGVVRTPY